MYRIEKGSGDIVIDGWERGIAASPYKGIGNIQSCDITSIPGEVMCNFSRTRQSQFKAITSNLDPLDSTHLTAGAGSGTNIGLLHGTWITITSSNITNVTNGASYYVLSSVAGSVQLSTTYEGSAVGSLGATGQAQFSVTAMGRGISKTWSNILKFPDYQYFILDSNGYLWQYCSSDSNPSWRMAVADLTDKKATPSTASQAIACYGNYILLLADNLYYKPINSLSTAWAAFSTNRALVSGEHPRATLFGQDAVLYWTDGYQIGALTVVAGSSPGAFSPTNNATYTFTGGNTTSALTLPDDQVATTLAELNTNLMIGTWSNKLYSWNRTPISIGGGSTLNSFFFPIFLPETYTQSLLTVNNLLYVFCGAKGNIYITNGTTVSPILTIPDYTTGIVEPYYIWYDSMYLRGKVFFSIQDSNSSTAGVWSFIPSQSNFIEQDTGNSLIFEAQNSYQSNVGATNLLFAPLESASQASGQTAGQQARGAQYWSVWDNSTAGASTCPYGIDYSNTTPTTIGISKVETDIIPSGEILGQQKKTFSNIEFKLGAPLVAGESVAINFRTNLTDGWASAGTVVYDTNTATGAIAGYISPLGFQNTLWVQLQAVLTSTTSSPSFVRLKEIQIREN